MEAIIARTVPPMADGHSECAVEPIAAEVVGAHIERQLTDVFTAPDQSILRLGLIDLTESVLGRKMRILSVPWAKLEDAWARPADCRTQALPTGGKPALQGHIDDAPHKMSRRV